MRAMSTFFIFVLFSLSFSTAQILTVTTEKDTIDAADGLLSLREAVDSANAAAGSQEIYFDGVLFAPASGRTILVKSSLILTDPDGVTINGQTRSVTLKPDPSLHDTIRFAGITIRAVNSTVANLIIRDFRGAGVVVDTGTTGPVVIGPGNKIIHNEEAGIRIIRSSGVTVTGNLVSESAWAFFDYGIAITDSSGGVIIEGNVVTYNYSNGIDCNESGPLTVRNNYVGRNLEAGIGIYNSIGTLIEENIIAVNGTDGISVTAGADITIQSNSIGDSLATFLVPTQAFSYVPSSLEDNHPVARQDRPGYERQRLERVTFTEEKNLRIRRERKSNPPLRELPKIQPMNRSATVASSAADHNGNGYNGISLYGVTNTVIQDNIIYGSQYDGIYVDLGYVADLPVHADDITIQHNRIERNNDSQIEFHNAGRMTIRNNSMSFSNYGIHSYTPIDTVFRSVNIIENYISHSNNGESIYLYNLDSVLVERNIIANCYNGLYMDQVTHAVIQRNEFSTIDGYAMELYADSVRVLDNQISTCYYGLYLSSPGEETGFAEIGRNAILRTSYDAFQLYNYEDANVYGNRIDGVYYYYAAQLGYIGSATLTDNSIMNSAYTGLYIYEVDSLTLSANNITGMYNDYSLYINYTAKAYVSGNTFSNSYSGSYFTNSDSLWIWNNKFLSSRGNGLDVYYADLVHAWGNDMYGHGSEGAIFYYVDSLVFANNNSSQNAQSGLSLNYIRTSLIRHNTLLENGYAGFSAYYDTTFRFEENFVALNEYGFVVYYTDTSSRALRNTFFRNLEGSQYQGVIQGLKADSNYWGDPTGPYDIDNTDGLNLTNSGKGDDVSEQINWSPFLTTPPYLSQSRPAITEIAPVGSPRSGGMTAALRGRQFLPGAVVLFGADTVQNVTYVSSDLLSFMIPPGRGGPVNVIVRNTNGLADTLHKGFHYENNTPHPFPLVSPAPNATIGTANPRFVWNRSFDPDGDNVEYILHYSNSNLFENVVVVEGIQDTSYLLPPNSLTANTTYYWRVVASDTREGFTTSAVHQFVTGLVLNTEGEETLPATFGLAQNYPNPFNPETSIRFQIPEQSGVTLRIFDVLGRQVVKLIDEERSAGFYTVVWNGGDAAGRQVASGIYFYRIEAGTFVETKRMLLLR